MTYVVTLRRAAERDVEGAQRWYEDQRTGLGVEFNAELDRILRILSESPLIYQFAYGGSTPFSRTVVEQLTAFDLG